MVCTEAIKQATGISLYDDEFCDLYQYLKELTEQEQDKILGIDQEEQ